MVITEPSVKWESKIVYKQSAATYDSTMPTYCAFHVCSVSFSSSMLFYKCFCCCFRCCIIIVVYLFSNVISLVGSAWICGASSKMYIVSALGFFFQFFSSFVHIIRNETCSGRFLSLKRRKIWRKCALMHLEWVGTRDCVFFLAAWLRLITSIGPNQNVHFIRCSANSNGKNTKHFWIARDAGWHCGI